MTSCIEVNGVTKRFGKVAALNALTLRLEENKIYGLLGRNGAGKTTLLSAITGRLFVDSGTITLDGQTILENDALLRQVYMMSEQTLFPQSMRVRAAFALVGEFYPDFDHARAASLAQRFGLDMAQRVKALSTGYASIFKLILALCSGARYVLLDEPVLGLDANHRELFYKALLELYAERPCCLVLSTHLVEEVSSIVEDVIIVNRGAVIHSGSREELLAQGYTVAGPAAAVDAYSSGLTVIGSDSLGGLKTAYILGQRPDSADGLEITRLDLQKLFVQMTND